MKKFVSWILCIATLCTMLVFGSAAADNGKTVALGDDVTLIADRLEGNYAGGLKLRFGDSLPFTGFDAEKSINIEVTFPEMIENMLPPGDPIATFTATPSAYDAQSGVLTVSFDKSTYVQQLSMVVDLTNVDPALLDPALTLSDAFISPVDNVFWYRVRIPSGLLTGDGVVNEENTYWVDSIEGQPVREEVIFTMPKWINKASESVLLQKISLHLLKLQNGTKAQQALYYISILPLLPLFLPSMIKIFRTTLTAFKEMTGKDSGDLFSLLK